MTLAALADADPDLAGETPELVRRIGACRQHLIEDFDAAAETLANQGAALEAVAAGFREALAGFESGDLSAASGQLAALSARSGALRGRLAEEAEQLEALSGMVQTARAPLAELARIIRTISMVSVTARVAASRLAGSSAAGEVLARDMAQLAIDADRGVREVSEHYEHLRQSFAEISQRHAALRGGVERDLVACLGRLERQARDLDVERARVHQAGQAAVALVDRIGQQVSTALMAVQAGDALSQRLDHVGHGLMRIDEARAEDPVAADLGLRIQAAQLDAAAGILEDESDTIETTLGALASDVRDGMSDLSRVQGVLADRAMASYEAEARQADALLDRCEQDAQTLDRLAETAASEVVALGRRLDAIRDIEQRMQLVSLNATIRCSKLAGEGRALVVVAQQLSELSLDTRVQALAAMRPLKEATGLARTIRKELKEQAGTQDRAAASSRAAGSRQVAQASAGRDDIARVWDRLAHAAPAAEKAATDIGSRLAHGAGRSRELRDAAETLRLATLPASTLPPGPMPRLLQRLRDAYSIAAERQVHDAILGLAPQDADPVLTGPASEDAFMEF